MLEFEDESNSLEERESMILFQRFLRLAALLLNKKTTLQTLFIATLSDPLLNRIAKVATEIDTDIDLCRYFLKLDPALAKSKAILQYAAQRKKESGY